MSLPVFTGWQLFLGGLFLLPITLVAEGLPESLTFTNIAAYSYLCLVGALCAYILFFRGIAHLPAAVVSSLGLLSPVSALLLGWIFLDQHMPPYALFGFVLVICSLYGVQSALQR